jgi:hypothetical protein
MPRHHAPLKHAHHEFLGDWTGEIVPDFAGRTNGGNFMVLLTAPNPAGGDPYWALGWSATSLFEAREAAVEQMARQRLDFVEVPLLLERENRAE